MVDSISSAMASQAESIQMQVFALNQAKQSGAIALQLIASAANLPQDPSTITPDQLKSPIDIRV